MAIMGCVEDYSHQLMENNKLAQICLKLEPSYDGHLEITREISEEEERICRVLCCAVCVVH